LRSLTLLLIVILCAERFAAVHFYLRYRELVARKRVVAVVFSIWFLSALFSLMRLGMPTSIIYLVFGGSHFACIIAGTVFSVKIYMSVRSHLNELQVLQLQQASQNGQTVNIKRLMKFAIMAVYVCVVLMICCLPNICFLFVIVFPVVGHLKLYTLTLAFLNSSLNPLICCWKMRHVQHTLIDLLRNAFSKRN